MATCVFSSDNPLSDIIPLEGAFVSSFIKDMDSDYVKVYLYCLYLLTHADAKSDSYTDIACACGVDIESVARAMEYFEQAGLLHKAGEHPLVIEVRSVKEAARLIKDNIPESLTRYGDYLSALRAVLGRDLKPAEITKATEWVDTYNLPQEVVVLLVQHCTELAEKEGKKAKATINYIDKVAAAWALNGITTVEDAEHYLTEYELEHHRVKEVMLHLGIKRMPSIEEVKLYEKWTVEWKFEHDAVIAACAETTKTTNPSFAYLDKIIENYKEALFGNDADSVREGLESDNKSREDAKAILRAMGISCVVTQQLLDIINTAYGMGVQYNTMLELAAELSKKAFKSVGTFEEELQHLIENDILTVDQLKARNTLSKQQDDEIKTVLSALNLHRSVTANDREIFLNMKNSGITVEMMVNTAPKITGYNKLQRLAEILLGNGSSFAVKLTAAHNYEARQSDNKNNVFTSLDELEDDD